MWSGNLEYAFSYCNIIRSIDERRRLTIPSIMVLCECITQLACMGRKLVAHVEKYIALELDIQTEKNQVSCPRKIRYRRNNSGDSVRVSSYLALLAAIPDLMCSVESTRAFTLRLKKAQWKIVNFSYEAQCRRPPT